MTRSIPPLATIATTSETSTTPPSIDRITRAEACPLNTSISHRSCGVRASPRSLQNMPSPGGQVSGMADTSAKPGRWGSGVWHPADLPEGYHAAPRGHAWQARPAVSGDGAPGAPRGRANARSTGCHTAPSVQDHPWSPGTGSITMVNRSRSGRLQAVRRRVATKIGENQ